MKYNYGICGCSCFRFWEVSDHENLQMHIIKHMLLTIQIHIDRYIYNRNEKIQTIYTRAY